MSAPEYDDLKRGIALVVVKFELGKTSKEDFIEDMRTLLGERIYDEVKQRQINRTSASAESANETPAR